MKLVATLTLLVAGSLSTGSALAQGTPPQMRNWTVTAQLTDSANQCSLRFRGPADGPSLEMVNRSSKKSSTPSAFFTLTNIPDLSTAAKASVDVVLTVGSGYSSNKVKGNWTKGPTPKASRVTFTGAPVISSVLEPIAQAQTLTITAADQTFKFDLTGSRRASRVFGDCLAL